MDRAEHSLTSGRELAQKRHNQERRLSIETRSRFIKEEKGSVKVRRSMNDSEDAKERSYGLLTSSTPIVKRLRCSTPSPNPG